ncbi:unnamed protein product [Ceratitis capitata]|uniref:(Mediterranean fruit fly) hypothetical protein n=1 Tax=Ceratitis capitata TaxID=7213 RepID=A0A811TZC5_CERCA|nr:unnamed protein product [Ceratitis capitata]
MEPGRQQISKKFATDKNLKRSNFREAIEQIEAALNGEDSAPIDLPEAALAVDETLDDGAEGFADVAGDESHINESGIQDATNKANEYMVDESKPIKTRKKNKYQL